MNPQVTKALFVTFVRPLLEYASQVWSPYQSIHINRIESVQRRFSRFALRGLPWVGFLDYPPYQVRLNAIGLQPLVKRRNVADIVFIHQILLGMIDSPFILERIHFNINPRALRTVSLFRVPYHRTNYGQNEPLTRMLRASNMNDGLFDLNISKRILKARLFSAIS